MNEDVEKLLEYYVLQYKQKYGVKPDLNHYRDSFGFAAMLHDYAFVEAQEIIEYYFRTGGEHNTRRLFENYDDLRRSKEKSDKDKERIERLMKETAKRIKKWESSHGQEEGN